MSRLLDEALPLDEAGRQLWLAGLSAEHQDIAQALREALRPKSNETDNPLGTLPKFGSDDEVGFAGMSGLEPGALLGPYQLIKLLGTGGMAEVWLARRADGAFNREVALKLPLLTRLRRDLEPRFAREREILAALSHPNIARLYDAGFAKDGQPFLALEYVVGTAFTSYCDEHRLTIRERLELFRQVLSAVQYAHSNLVIHRDLKPSNVLVTEAGQVQLLDFGIAKLLSEGEAKETELTQLSGRSLTPDYASPEQIAGAPITTAADVYALGVILYELLTGTRPYRLRRDTRAALEEAILQAEPAPPSRAAFSEPAATARDATAKRLSKALKGDLDIITLKALKKSPKERYQTASVLDEEIARFLAGEVVLAQPDSVTYRAAKFARRHWLAISVVGLIVLSLALGLAATNYEARVASSERDLAEQARLRSLTQTAAARLRDGDVSGAMSIVLEVLPHGKALAEFTPEALSVFQQALAADAQILVISGETASGGKPGRLWSANFSPDATRVVTGSDDGTARIWEARTGRQLLTLRGHSDRVFSATFSPDGHRVATASYDGTALIWDAATGRLLTSLRGHTDKVWWVAFSPDGAHVVSASSDQTARIWDPVTGRELHRLVGHSDKVVMAKFSPDSNRVATASSDGTARLWDAATGRELAALRGHTDSVTAASFSPDGKRIVTASHDTTARVWDVATGRVILFLSGHTDRVRDASFSPDGARIVTASTDKTARIWNAASGREIAVLAGHADMVEAASFSPDGRQIVTASPDKTVRIWDAIPYRERATLLGHTDRVYSAVFSADGHRILTGSYDHTARVWDAATGQQVLNLSGHSDRLFAAVFSPDDTRIATASDDRTARLWDARTGRPLTSFKGHADRVYHVAFSPDGRRIVTASDDKTARVWDATTGAEVLRLRGHTDVVETAVFSPDGQRIATASDDGTVRLWNASTGEALRVIAASGAALTSLAFAPDGNRVVTSSRDESARIWEVASGRELVLLRGHTDQVNTVAFSADGNRVVTTSNDGSTRVWDSATGFNVLLLRGHAGSINHADFSPDGASLVTSGADRSAIVWDATSAPLDLQIAWAEAARFDLLSPRERFELGVPAQVGVRTFESVHDACDDAAAAPDDPGRRAAGVPTDRIVPELAAAACSSGHHQGLEAARIWYQHGRALLAAGRAPEAQADFARAWASGYDAAALELGLLLAREPGQESLAQGLTLLERAFRGGVSRAAFELGAIYEEGLPSPSAGAPARLAPNPHAAWNWYRVAAAAGSPDAMARFAQSHETLASEAHIAATRDRELLAAFRAYASATNRAFREAWPEGAWLAWRYRRASLARVLAREGMLESAARAFTKAAAFEE